MKKLFKRLLSITMALCCLLGVSTNVFAATTPDNGTSYSVTKSEYEILVEEKLKSKAKTMRDSEPTIEEQLLALKDLSDSELSTIYGLNTEQISILRDYTGTPIEETPELRSLLSATLYGTLSRTASSNTSVSFRYYWVWSARPVFASTDEVVVATLSSNTQGANSNVRFTNKSCSVNYYTTSGTSYGTESLSPLTGSNCLSVEFDLANSYTGSESATYVKEGFLYGTCTPQVSGTYFGAIDAIAAYGHSTYDISPSFSISPFPLSISFNSTTTTYSTGIVTLY